MITGELKSKVDNIWNTMWSGGISNPLSVIEQLTYLLFIKRLDELHTLKERKAARAGKPIEDLSELGQKHLSDTPRKITKAGLKSCSARMLPAQSVLFSSRAPIGLVAINTIPVCTNQGFKSLVPRFDLVSPDFLFWWLKAQEKHVQSKGRGATFKEVSKKIVEDLQIPLPPLAEQKRIAAILDAADALRAKRREALAQLDSLLQSTFLDMFGDPVTNSNIPSAIMTELVTKFIDYRGKSPEKSNGGVPLITAKIVKDKEVKEPNEFIPADSYDAWMRRGIPNPGDVVITTEAPMGEVALVPDFKAAFAQRLLVLQPDETKVKSIYLMWALTMPFVIRQLRQRSTGSTVTGIRSREFKKVTLPIPSLDLQCRFAAIVHSVEHQKASQRAHLTELDTLFASLQSRAFRGNL